MEDKAFYFSGCFEIKELLGVKAKDELELLEAIETVPLDSIYFHTHSYFLRHPYISEFYPNDFANWVSIQIRDKLLGEKLGSITPTGQKTLEDIREEFLEMIDNHLASLQHIPSIIYGEPFHFMASQIIEIPTEIKASNLSQFIKRLNTVDASTVYNHIFEARLRLERGESDFAIWFKEVLGITGLAEKIERIDCYMHSLEEIRQIVIDLCSQELETMRGK